MTEAQAISQIFHMIDGKGPYLDDEVRLMLSKAMAFYLKKSFQVDAFNSLVESIQHSINAKQFIMGSPEDK